MSQKGEQTRATIIACAQRLFYERGYDATSFSHIVEASGLLRGNIYHYFKSKDEILLAVIANHLAEFQALVDQWQQERPEPRERLLAFTEMLAGRSSALIEYGCPIGTLNVELGKDRRDLQAKARALFDLFRDWLAAQYLALGYPDSEARALHLLGRAQGIALLSHVYHDEALLAREIAHLREWIVSQ